MKMICSRFTAEYLENTFILFVCVESVKVFVSVIAQGLRIPRHTGQYLPVQIFFHLMLAAYSFKRRITLHIRAQ